MLHNLLNSKSNIINFFTFGISPLTSLLEQKYNLLPPYISSIIYPEINVSALICPLNFGALLCSTLKYNKHICPFFG